MSAVQVNNLTKSFHHKTVLSDLELTIPKGSMVALIGASGSGKSTLLRHLAGLTTSDKADGLVQVLGQKIQNKGVLNSNIRRQRADIGYIFQQFNLVARLTVLQNVLLGCLGRMSRVRGTLGLFNRAEKERAFQALERVGLLEFAHRRASTLSGGQQQRVAIARTLCQNAEIILADEPIASLDPESARKVMDTLKDINVNDGKTVIVTLHQVNYAMKYCRHAIALKDGKKCIDGPVESLTPAFLHELYSSEVDKSLLFGATEDRQSNSTVAQCQFNAVAV